MILDIIISVYNKEKSISNYYNKLEEELKNIKHRIIFVDDASNDKTLEVLKEIQKENEATVKIISLAKKHDKDTSIYAGLCNITHDLVCIVDLDLQANISYISKMYEFITTHTEYDQVCMLPNKRKNMSLVKRIGGHLFYKLMNRLSTIKFMEDASDFRMFNTSVKEAVLSLSENNRFSKGIFNWVGFNTKSMIYDVEPRLYGKTKFNFKRSVNYALIGIIDYAENPLNIFARLGLINLFGGFVLLIYLVIKSIILNELYMKFYLLLAIIFILAGIIMLGISFICLYLSRMQVEIKKRPIYIIKKIQEK